MTERNERWFIALAIASLAAMVVWVCIVADGHPSEGIAEAIEHALK